MGYRLETKSVSVEVVSHPSYISFVSPFYVGTQPKSMGEVVVLELLHSVLYK